MKKRLTQADLDTFTISRDTREQLPYTFEKWPTVDVKVLGLKEGDYGLAEFPGQVAVERKSLDDLVGSICTGRDRFERELLRSMDYEHFAVVVEGSFEDVRLGRYTSNMKPHSVFQSCFSFEVRYGVHFVWAGSRNGGEYATWSILQKYRRWKLCWPRGESEVPLSLLA